MESWSQASCISTSYSIGGRGEPLGWQKVANCLQLFMKMEGVVINANQGFNETLVNQKSTMGEAMKALLPKRLLGW